MIMQREPKLNDHISQTTTRDKKLGGDVIQSISDKSIDISCLSYDSSLKNDAEFYEKMSKILDEIFEKFKKLFNKEINKKMKLFIL